ncbi:magnesium and cobalt transport protein CorA [Granulicoccus sp. GXG6511]|uniref:magnesium and cobalt transport protein CorA n=1 Tax=Granulicoccus sp. GXG6511 TaxID=3381351 RepID=UPI003D7CA40D
MSTESQQGPGQRRPGPHTLMAADGEPPDSVVAWGLYVDGVRQETADLDNAAQRATTGEGFVWLGLKDPSDEDMAGFAARFNLHPLAIEDAVEGHTRSKLEQFGDTLFCVISTVAYVDHAELTDSSEIVSTGQIMVFVGEHFVMTVRRGEHAQLQEMRAKLERKPNRLAHGTYEVLYAVLDKVIEDYIMVVSEFETDIEEVETAVFSRQGTNEVDRVYQLKRELIEFKRSVIPLGMPLHALATRPLATIPDGAQAYFRELSDHHLEAREAIQSFDEVLSTILSAGLARASVADNQDMRKISAFVAIVAIPTMIAGIYGMNFDNMPELRTHYGYFVVIAIMLVIMAGLYIGFRRNKWL